MRALVAILLLTQIFTVVALTGHRQRIERLEKAGTTSGLTAEPISKK